jgi:hypothetical protein
VATNPTRAAPPAPARRPFWRSRGFWIYVVALLALNWLFTIFFTSGPTRITVPYTTFIEQVTAGNVKTVTAQSNSIQGEFKQPVASGSQSGTLFQTERPVFAQDNLETLLQQQNIPITATAPGSGQSPLLSLLLGFGPTLLLVAAFIYLSQRAAGGAGGILGSFGRSQAKLYTADTAGRTTFNDVAGIDEAKQDLAEVVDFLRTPEKYQRLGATIPHGVLLVGPPGTGKTLLARAVAGESNRPFFSLSASEFVEAIVGVGASRVRDLFAQAKAASPSIIFIDELDAIGRSRAAGAGFGGNDEREQTLNQILTEMDGFTQNQNVVVLAATNRPEVLGSGRAAGSGWARGDPPPALAGGQTGSRRRPGRHRRGDSRLRRRRLAQRGQRSGPDRGPKGPGERDPPGLHRCHRAIGPRPPAADRARARRAPPDRLPRIRARADGPADSWLRSSEKDDHRAPWPVPGIDLQPAH